MTDTASHLLAWYGANARALPWRNPPGRALPDDPDWPYRVWLSEIMLQQTTVAAVQGYFAAFAARWPDVVALATADDSDVMQAWAGLGYYARARNLLACARAVVADHGGRFPADVAMLRSLPGIGAYTAAAIAAFGFGGHAIVIDGNVERVITRLFAIDTPLPAARAEIHAALAAITPARAGDFAQGLMDLASRICTPKSPRCTECPINAGCCAAASDGPTRWPVKPPKRSRPTRHGTAWWLAWNDQVLLVTRPAKGLLGGMKALPTCDWSSRDAAPPVPGEWHDLGAVSHGFTHFELVLTVRALHLAEKPQLAGDWWNIAQLDRAGLPTLFAKAATLAAAQMMEKA